MLAVGILPFRLLELVAGRPQWGMLKYLNVAYTVQPIDDNFIAQLERSSMKEEIFLTKVHKYGEGHLRFAAHLPWCRSPHKPVTL